jgi:hypothetical protein
MPPRALLAPFRRKTRLRSTGVVSPCDKSSTRRPMTGGSNIVAICLWIGSYVAGRAAIARPILMRLSAMTPRPTQRFIPSSPR